MKISNLYMPSPGPAKTAEESIVVLGAYKLLEEVREVIFKTKVLINPTKTSKKGKGGAKGATGNKGLTPKINRFLKYGLSHFGWAPHYSRGALNKNKKIDWFKTTPDPYWSQREGGGIGIGVETQFGNNFQAHGDIQRLQAAFNTFEIGAGLIIVPSDDLSQYLADRCANYSNTVSKLQQQIDTMLGARAFNICPIGIIAVSHDAFTASLDEPYSLSSPWLPESGDVEDDENEGEDGEVDEEEESVIASA
jgi:hypothetical protein